MLSRFNLSICGLLRIYALVAELLIKTVYSYLELRFGGTFVLISLRK